MVIRKHRRGCSRIVVGRKLPGHKSFVVVADKGEPTGFVVSGDNHQRFAVGIRKPKRLTHGAVKIQYFFHHLGQAVGVDAVINLRSFGHQ